MTVDKKHAWMSLSELEVYTKAHPEFRDNDHKKWKGAKWKDDGWVTQREGESTFDVQMRLFGRPLGGSLPQRRSTPKQHSARSISVAQIKNLKLASSVDLRQWCTGIEDQGAAPSCDAYTTVAGFEWLQNNRTGQFVDGSERFVASNYGIPPMGTDAALYETETVGVPPKSMWDWNGGNPSISWENDLTITAPEEVYTTAAYYKTTQAQLVASGIDATIEETTATLNSIKAAFTTFNAPIYMRLLIYPNTMSGANGVMLCPTGPWVGGAGYGAHSMLCVGYSDAAEYLIFQNSWGTANGDYGYYYMPYEFVTEPSTAPAEEGGYEPISNVFDCWTIYGENCIDIPPDNPDNPPAGAPTVYLTQPGQDTHHAMTLTHAAAGSGDWATESLNKLYLGNASPYDSGPVIKIGYFCWYNYEPDEPSLEARYESFSDTRSVTILPTTTTVTVSNAHPAAGVTFTVSGSVKTGAAPGTAVTGETVYLVSDDGAGNYVQLGSPPTNSSGNFTLNTSIGEVGVYTITASVGDITLPNGTRYSSSFDTVGVTIGTATTATTLSISTTNSNPSQNTGFTISGVLNDVSSNHLQGKTITLSITDTYNTKRTYGTTTTNAGGSYSFANISKSIAGTYIIEAKFAGDAQYSSSSHTLNVTVVISGTLQPSLTIELSDDSPALTVGYAVFGVLSDNVGNPIPNATVYVVVQDAMPTPHQTQTATNGSYSFTLSGEGTAGTYTVIVSYNGNATYSGCEATGYVTFFPETLLSSSVVLRPIIRCIPNLVVNTSVRLVGAETQHAIETFRPHFCKTIRLNPTITATTDKLDVNGKTKKLVFKGADVVLGGEEHASFTSHVSQRSVAELSVTEWHPAPVFKVSKTLHLVVTVGRSIKTYVREDIILPIGDEDLVTRSYEMDLKPIQEIEKLHVRGRAYEHSTAAPHNYHITIPQEPIVINTAETVEYNAKINFSFQTTSNMVVVSADANLLFLPPETAHKAVDYTFEVRKLNGATRQYDLLGVIDGKITPSLTQELGLADVLSFNMQLSDQKTLIATDFKRGNEIWYYGRDAQLKQVFVIQRVEFYRDYGASGLSSGGSTLGSGSGDNVFISAGGPEVYLTWYYFENDYTAIQKKPIDILNDLCGDAMMDGVISTWWVDPSLNTPIDISFSWENLKTACDSITKQTGGVAKVVVDPIDPTFRTLELLPNGSTPGTYYPTSQYWLPGARRYGDTRKVSVTSTDLPVVVFDTFPKLGNEIQNDGGNGLLDCDGFMHCNNVFTMKNGATAAGFDWADDYIKINSCSPILNLYTVTVEMCARINNTVTDGCLFSKGQGGSTSFSMVYDHTYKRIIVSRGTIKGNVDSWTTPDNSVPPNDWYYIQLLWAAGVQPAPNNPPQIIIDNVIMNVTHHSIGTGYWHGDFYYDLYIGNDYLKGSALDGAISLFRLYSYVINTPIDNFLRDGWRREVADAPVNFDTFPIPISNRG